MEDLCSLDGIIVTAFFFFLEGRLCEMCCCCYCYFSYVSRLTPALLAERQWMHDDAWLVHWLDVGRGKKKAYDVFVGWQRICTLRLWDGKQGQTANWSSAKPDLVVLHLSIISGSIPSRLPLGERHTSSSQAWHLENSLRHPFTFIHLQAI